MSKPKKNAKVASRKPAEQTPTTGRQRVKIIGGNGKVRWEWREAL